MLPLISIGLPVYNGEKFIDRAISNILSQDYPNLELLISDNCSNDATSSICQIYNEKDQRVKYLKQKTNIGGPANYKEVLFKSSGDLFMWHASDDWIEGKSYISDLYNSLSDNYDYAMPETKMVNASTGSETYIFSKFFSPKQEKKEFINAAAKYASFQFYSLYRKPKLIEFWPFLWKCRNYASYWEGLFVTAVSSELKGVFVRSATFVYFNNPLGWSSSLPSKKAIKPFCKYAINSFVYISKTNNLSFLDKYLILSSFAFQHIYTAIYLSLSILKRIIVKKV